MQSAPAIWAIARIWSLSSSTMLESVMEALAPQHSVLFGQSMGCPGGLHELIHQRGVLGVVEIGDPGGRASRHP